MSQISSMPSTKLTKPAPAPRFSATSNLIDISNRIPGYAVEPLESEGYQIERSPLTIAFAAPHAIDFHKGQPLRGGADPSHDGVALTVRQGRAA